MVEVIGHPVVSAEDTLEMSMWLLEVCVCVCVGGGGVGVCARARVYVHTRVEGGFGFGCYPTKHSTDCTDSTDCSTG